MNNWRGVLEMIRRTATVRGRAQTGLFAIEGIRLHERAVRAGVQVQQTLLAKSFWHDPGERIQNLISDLKAMGCQLHVIPDDVATEVASRRTWGGIIGLLPIPEQPSLTQLISCRQETPPLLLTAVDVTEPGNVGALIRTAHATGATAFIATGSSTPYHPTAVRTSMGSILKLPILRFPSIKQVLIELNDLGIETAATVVTGGTPLPQTIFSSSGTAVLMGSEYWGLTEDTLTTVDQIITIPMVADIDSLSVNAAAAIMLYEIGRRHW